MNNMINLGTEGHTQFMTTIANTTKGVFVEQSNSWSTLYWEVNKMEHTKFVEALEAIQSIKYGQHVSEWHEGFTIAELMLEDYTDYVHSNYKLLGEVVDKGVYDANIRNATGLNPKVPF